MAKSKFRDESEFLDAEEETLQQASGESEAEADAAAGLPKTTAPKPLDPKQKKPVARFDYEVKFFHRQTWRGPFVINAVDESEAIQRLLDKDKSIKSVATQAKFHAERVK